MIKGLTASRRYFVGRIIAVCLILTAGATLVFFTSCSPRAVRTTYTRPIAQKVEAPKVKEREKNAKTESPKSNENPVDEIRDFESKIDSDELADLLNKTKIESNEDLNKVSDSQIVSEAIPGEEPDLNARRLPTLREQMAMIGKEQEAIKDDVSGMKSDIKEIKESISQINRAVGELAAKTPPDAVAGNVAQSEPVRSSTTRVSATILPDEKAGATGSKTRTQQTVQSPIVSETTSARSDNREKFRRDDQKTDEYDAGFGRMKVESGRYNEAVVELKAVVEKIDDPIKRSECRYWLGKAYLGLRQYVNAIDNFKRAIGPEGAEYADDAAIAIAEAYLKSGQTEMAKAGYQDFVSKFPRSEHLPVARRMLQQL